MSKVRVHQLKRCYFPEQQVLGVHYRICCRVLGEAPDLAVGISLANPLSTLLKAMETYDGASLKDCKETNFLQRQWSLDVSESAHKHNTPVERKPRTICFGNALNES